MKKSQSFLPVKERIFAEDTYQSLINLGVNPIKAKILSARENALIAVSQSTGKALLSFRKLKGIEDACTLLEGAVTTKQKIVIVADYDSDGATSCAIALTALRSFGAKVEFAVPNRFIHGYGLTPSVVDLVQENFAPDLIVTVDNGTSSLDGINRAHMFGIKVLVTDHHLPGDVMPSADALVNPNQPGCEFESKNLAGCGVIFYVMAALRERLKAQQRLPESAILMSELLDFVAIGTIADVVKLDVNNRLLARMGLDRIRSGKSHPGVAALFTVARRSMPRATSKDIGFAIGPRINAAGRLADMSVGIQCLTSNSYQHALELALKLEDLNSERKSIENQMQEIAIDSVWTKSQDGVPSAICVFDPSFHEGVIGIVAGRIKEKEHRPTIVFAPAQEEAYIKGSGRSIPGFHIRDALDLVYKSDPKLLSKFGGHAMAAGLTIKKEDFPRFDLLFQQISKSLLNEEMLSRFAYVDGDVPAEYLTLDFAEWAASEVWGQGFPEPVFRSQFRILNQRLIKDAHLKLELEKDGVVFESIWFFKDQVMQSATIEAVFSIEPMEFRGDVSLQLQIVQARELLEA